MQVDLQMLQVNSYLQSYSSRLQERMADYQNPLLTLSMSRSNKTCYVFNIQGFTSQTFCALLMLALYYEQIVNYLCLCFAVLCLDLDDALLSLKCYKFAKCLFWWVLFHLLVFCSCLLLVVSHEHSGLFALQDRFKSWCHHPVYISHVKLAFYSKTFCDLLSLCRISFCSSWIRYLLSQSCNNQPVHPSIPLIVANMSD